MNIVNAEQLHEMMLTRPAVPVIDVLPPETHRKAHIPGTANVPVEDPGFVEKVHRVAADKRQPVVVYCAHGGCDASTRAGRELEAAGYENVHDFSGGMQAWEAAGYSLVAT